MKPNKSTYITERYVGYDTAVKLNELNFEKYVSKYIAMPHYDLAGSIWEPTIGVPKVGFDILCPTVSLVREFLAQVYGIEVFITPKFGKKTGYDSFEILGYMPEIHYRDENDSFMLDGDDFNKSALKEVEGDFHGEFWRQMNNPIKGTYQDALADGVTKAVELLSNKEFSVRWLTLLEMRKNEYLAAQKKPVSFPEAIYFDSTYTGDLHSALKLDQVMGDKAKYVGYFSNKFWVELKWVGDSWQVTDAHNNLYLGATAVGTTIEEIDRLIKSEMIQEDEEKRR